MAILGITKRIVDGARVAGSDVFIWDNELHGFGLRVRPAGRRSFILQYRTLEGRQRRRVLGKYPILTADQARKDAREWLERVEKGKRELLRLEKKGRKKENPLDWPKIRNAILSAQGFGWVCKHRFGLGEVEWSVLVEDFR